MFGVKVPFGLRKITTALGKLRKFLILAAIPARSANFVVAIFPTYLRVEITGEKTASRSLRANLQKEAFSLIFFVLFWIFFLGSSSWAAPNSVDRVCSTAARSA